MTLDLGAPRAALGRPVVAEIDLGALAANLALLNRLVAPAALCVVVKADAYGHGAVEVARTAERVGVHSVAVALVDEGVELRRAGYRGRILVLAETDAAGVARAIEHDLALTLYTERMLEEARAQRALARRPLRLHLKADTGMHRLGADHELVLRLAREVAATTGLELEGLFTHLAVAEELTNDFTAQQLERLGRARAALRAEGIDPPILHAGNSAGAIAHPSARLDLVRVGIACYGLLPSPELAPVLAAQLPTGEHLRPVLRLTAQVHLVRRLAAGERTSYGQRYELSCDSTVVTVPIGYADGVPRRLGEGGGEVLIGGRRRPIAGTVTMDHLIIDCGEDERVRPGDEVVLLGRQGEEEIDAWEWAARTGTIAYEIVTRIGPRVPRVYVGGDSTSER